MLDARPLTAALLPLALLACSSGPEPVSTEPDAVDVALEAARSGSAAIRIDGDLAEWPGRAAAAADGDHVYVRFSTGGPIQAIQSASEQTVLWFDLDADPATGMRPTKPDEATTLGVDLEIRFSPLDANTGELRGGAAATFFSARGDGEPGYPTEAGFLAAPTFAADWYEARLSRHLDAVPQLAGRLEAAEARGITLVQNDAGEVLGHSDAWRTPLPPRNEAETRRNEAVPAREPGTLRVVSYNVLRGTPMRETAPFANLFTVLDADVILLQEWTDGTADDIRKWFSALVPSGGQPWHVVTNGGWGVAIVSRYPLTNLTPDPLPRTDDRGVRFVAAIAETPIGPALVGTMHLKCCGGADGSEDMTRRDEAEIIASFMRQQDAAIRVIGGDVNLVGSRTPMDTLMRGTDADGSNLAAADTHVLGDDAVYTWRSPTSWFGPGRLDWLYYGDAAAEAVHAFAVDTKRIGDRALGRHGLYRADTDASDHLPIVLDLRPR